MRKGRTIKNVNNTLFFLIFHQDWFLRFQPWLERQLLPKEGAVMRHLFQGDKYILELVYLLFLFSTTKSWKLQKSYQRSLLKEMQSPKKSVNHTNKVYYWDHLSLAAVHAASRLHAAWEQVVRNSIWTSPNKIWWVYPSFLRIHTTWENSLSVEANETSICGEWKETQLSAAIPSQAFPRKMILSTHHPTEKQNLHEAAPYTLG